MTIRLAASIFLGASTLWAQSYTISTFAGYPLPPLPAGALNVSVGSTMAIASDTEGNLYWSSAQLNAVFKVSQNGLLAPYAGNGFAGYSGDYGQANNAQLKQPWSVVVDTTGNLYIADQANNCVRKVSSAGVITTFAGTGTAGYSGDNEAAAGAQLDHPYGVAVDGSGNVYIADTANLRIRKVSALGVITTIAGNGQNGLSGDNGPAINAQIGQAEYLAADTSGNVYISESQNCSIRKVSTTGGISTIAGGNGCGYSGDGGPAVNAALHYPQGITLDTQGNLYIADSYNYVIRKVSTNGMITTIAGTPGKFGYQGDGGPAVSAQLLLPISVTRDGAGNLYVIDNYHRVRKVSSAGIISTYAGDGETTYSGDGGPAALAQFDNPNSAQVDPAGNVYVADSANCRIRKVSATGAISTVAGNGTCGYSGDGGPATAAELNYPSDVALDSQGNLYIADTDNFVVRRISAGGTISTFAGNGTYGYSGDGGPAAGAQFAAIYALALDSIGDVYISDPSNSAVRMVSASGMVSTVPGPIPTPTTVYDPTGLALDSTGNLYVTDTANGAVLKISTGGTISTIAGTGCCGYSGDGGPATAAALNYPSRIAFDPAGNLLIADSFNNVIRRISGNGIISTIAGSGIAGYSGDGGLATGAQLSTPYGITLGQNGTIYIEDSNNNSIRELTPCPQLSTTSAFADSTAQTLNIGIAVAPACQWSTSNLPSWVVSASPAGSGTLAVTLQANTTAADRTGTISVNGFNLTITQQSTAQVFTDVTPGSYYFDAVDLLSKKGLPGPRDLPG
jgi:sugar lactone lactonase YvrE